jgi:hypothetical protein
VKKKWGRWVYYGTSPPTDSRKVTLPWPGAGEEYEYKKYEMSFQTRTKETNK